MGLSRIGSCALTVVNPLRHFVTDRMSGVVSVITAIALAALTHQIVSRLSWRWDISPYGLKNVLTVSAVFFSVFATLGYTIAVQIALICAAYKLLYTKPQTENLPLPVPTSTEIKLLKKENDELAHKLETITWEAGASKEETTRLEAAKAQAREERDQETARCTQLRKDQVLLEEEIRTLKKQLIAEQTKQSPQDSKVVRIELHLSDSYKQGMACLEQGQEMPEIDLLVAGYKEHKEQVHAAIQKVIDAQPEHSELRVLLESLLQISDDLERARAVFEFLGTIYADQAFNLQNQNQHCRREVFHGQ